METFYHSPNRLEYCWNILDKKNCDLSIKASYQKYTCRMFLGCPVGCLHGYNGIKCDVSVQDTSIKEPFYFGVASLVGDVVGTLITVLLMAVGVHLCVIRIQWIENSEDKRQVHDSSRYFTQMRSISPRPAETSEHAQSNNHVYNNEYAVLDTGTKTDKKDYDVIKPNYYQNV